MRCLVLALGVSLAACGGGRFAEPSGYGEDCASGGACPGGLRCVAWRDIAGRERRSCLFECADGCPDGWVCAAVIDGPFGVCQPRSQSANGPAPESRAA
ncbi:MAG: hypothetical protein ACXWLM_07025 [Myxococcales bacterium]